MRHAPWVLAVSLAAACGSPVPPRQADGADCNYAEAATACGERSYCDPGEPAAGQGFARRHTWGIFGDKMHVVGTCRPKGAAGAPCRGTASCVSGRCVSPAGGAGTCE